MILTNIFNNDIKIIERKIVKCYTINVKIKEQRKALQMNKIAKTVGIVYIYIYVSFNLKNCLYKHKAIFPYAFLMNSKMYVQK